MKLTFKADTAPNANELRQRWVESILDQIVSDIIAGDYPIDLAAKSLKPLVDTYQQQKVKAQKGYAAQAQEMIRETLEQAIAARESATEAPSDTDKGVAKGKAKAA